MSFKYTYEIPIERILLWFEDPPLPTRRNEREMQTALREIELRLRRMDLGGHSSLSLDRIADRLETALRTVRQQIRQYEQQYHCVAENEVDLAEDWRQERETKRH